MPFLSSPPELTAPADDGLLDWVRALLTEGPLPGRSLPLDSARLGAVLPWIAYQLYERGQLETLDETDREEPLFESLAGGNLLVHGRMPIDQLEGLLDEMFEEGDWDTVGGLIFHDLGHVPEVGESVMVGGVRLEVEGMEGRRITRVRVHRNVGAESDGGADG